MFIFDWRKNGFLNVKMLKESNTTSKCWAIWSIASRNVYGHFTIHFFSSINSKWLDSVQYLFKFTYVRSWYVGPRHSKFAEYLVRIETSPWIINRSSKCCIQWKSVNKSWQKVIMKKWCSTLFSFERTRKKWQLFIVNYCLYSCRGRVTKANA